MAQPSSPANRAGARRTTVVAALLAAGCGHTEPFTSPPYGSDAPFDDSPPVRLTYNPGSDQRPWWLADGTALIYSTQQLDRRDKDVCLGLLGATGGTRRQLWCTGPSETQEIDAIESATISPGGRLGFVKANGSTTGVNPARQDIAIAPSLDPTNAQRVHFFPNLEHGAASQTSAEHLRWMDDARLLYVDQVYHVRRLCRDCPIDTVRVGKSLAILNVDQPGAEPFVLPGTEEATGVALAPGGAAILYTVAGDSRVHRRSLTDGVEDVLYDFGPGEFARDIHVAANRMALIVGGRVAYGLDFGLGLMQWDSGGTIHVVDLNSGADLVLDGGARVFRRPALSPDGTWLVAEGYVVTEVEPGVATVGRESDLYLFGTGP